MSGGIEPWVDLLCGWAVQRRGGGLAVAFNEAQRAMPVLDQVSTVVWVHPRPVLAADFSFIPHQHPASRTHVDVMADPEQLRHWMGRSILKVLAMPVADLLPPVLTRGTGSVDDLWLIHGASDAPGWSDPALVELCAGWVSLPAPAGWRVDVNLVFLRVLRDAGLTVTAFDAALGQRLCAALDQRTDVHLDTSMGMDRLRLRLRLPAVRCIATTSDALRHHIMLRDKALFSPRGMATVLLPWSGCTGAKFLLRNVRARVDDMIVALGDAQIKPAAVHYTDLGAFVTFDAPPLLPGRDALMHLSLPRAAVPTDDFCEIGAAEFTSELA